MGNKEIEHWLNLPRYMTTKNLGGILHLPPRRTRKLCREVLSGDPYYAAFKMPVGKRYEWRIDPERLRLWIEDCAYGPSD